MAPRVLMIGGTGLIGPWAVAELRRLAPEAQILAMNRRGRAPEGATALAGDRHDAQALRGALEAARPDVLIDMIPFTMAEAKATVDALSRHGAEVRVVAVSSADVYAAFSRLNRLIGGEPEVGPITEDSPLREGEGGQGAGYDKLGVERTYAALPTVAALRLPAVYGWPDAGRIAPWLEPMLEGAESLRLHPAEAGWRFARVLNRNAGFAVALAALRAGPGFRAWNVAEPVSPTTAEWVARIARAAGWEGRIVEDHGEEAPGFRADQPIALEDARIREELGFHERHDPDEGLADAVRRIAAARQGRAAPPPEGRSGD
jgi:nucleoside-diphosphate-sugar epimerase